MTPIYDATLGVGTVSVCAQPLRIRAAPCVRQMLLLPDGMCGNTPA